jgi:hypothetical protein
MTPFRPVGYVASAAQDTAVESLRQFFGDSLEANAG